ncbi:hypothetical protein J421_5583 (plasmid) [Gemmatirosa kalamazoonensis]|uniref:Lipocalin-like domain-containing protein n=1 Tax=Gemmatirosa kalamazoonensis TaxID=861299 RepID=W0RU52_9BACT|nr:hypothetical protein [Gemmatirosa kalamazoonensis]AHG93118.1 hypothetical protein J421_5583 [Gemmatirosa kalamazoonensis]
MRRLTHLAVFCLVAAVACAKKDTAANSTAADTTTPAAVAAPTPPPPAPLTLADVAGKWNMRAVPDSGDTTATTYVMTATADSTWTLQFPNGLKVPVKAMASGDSITVHAGPYASVRRKGMQVTTDGAFRRQGDRLTGTSTAHYKTTRPDSVLHLRVEGTKAP